MDEKFLSRSREILTSMMDRGALTIPEITSSVGMSLPIVTEVINQLVKAGKLVELTGVEKPQAGRPPTLYKLNAEAGYTIGIELGRISSNCVVLDYSQKMIFEYHRKSILSKDNESIFLELEKLINHLLKEVGITKKQLLGIGISIPGIVQGETGTSQTYLKVENNLLLDHLEKRLGVRVRIEHDVKSMALGEIHYGAAQNVNNALYINYGWGLGIGIIMNGQLYYGNEGFAGEFGHIPLVPNGELCYCGKQGCLETISSGRAITKLVNDRLSAGASSMILKSKKMAEKVDPIDILKAANQGDQFAIEILEEAGKYLGIGIAILINLFNPGHIIIGGTISQVASYLLDSLKNNAMKHSIVQLNKNVIFEISDLKNNSGALGVARLTSIKYCCDI